MLNIPALEKYVKRIGAEQLNFRRYIVRDYHGSHYYHEKCLITLMSDGEVKVTNKEYAPTKEEAEKIKKAVEDVEWPSAALATEAQVEMLREKIGSGAVLYLFWDRKTGAVRMVQERKTAKDGSKSYLPWTMWNDGQWRMMEPGDKLPFWKPKVGAKPGACRVMIHEGAKTAEFVTDLIADQVRCEAHPWGDALKLYEHWGMIGGALAPQRTDYDELYRQRPLEVVYVCDNDYPGKSALQIVSACYGKSLLGVVPTDSFPPSWDLADAFPKSMYRAGRFVGTKLSQLMTPATWATETVPQIGSGRPGHRISSDFAKEWYHSVHPEVYVHKGWADALWTEREFNSNVRPFSDVEDTARRLRTSEASKSMTLKYSPADPPGVYVNGRQSFFNTHVPSAIVAEKGDWRPWSDFMEHLVPDSDDRKELMRWCATLIARPDIKMSYGVLLISGQGIGKGTLGEKILSPLVGEHNASYPSEETIVDSEFNYWAAHKRLAVVHEIYAGHSSRAYNKLKSIVTDKVLTVNKKFMAAYEIENWLHIFACSNSMRAIKMAEDDRRWFVPGLTEDVKDKEWWSALNLWLEEGGGLGKIKSWAYEFLKEERPVMPSEIAPSSETKKDILLEGYSPGQLLVLEFLEHAKEELNGEPWGVLDTDLVALIRERIYEGRQNDRLERQATICKIAKGQGFHIVKNRVQLKEWGTAGVFPRLITNNKDWVDTKPLQLVKAGVKPLDVRALAQKWMVMR